MLIKKIQKIFGALLLIICSVYLIADIDFKDIAKHLLELQFIPMFLKYGIISIYMFLLLLLTFIFGRFYCSIFCPTGIMQDYLSKIKVKKIKLEIFNKIKNLKYLILLINLFLLFIGSLAAINIFDPYSNFGKIINTVFRPIYIYINNLIYKVLVNFEIYNLDMKMYSPVNVYISILVFIFFFLLLSSLIFEKRFYCNYICPVGTFLSLFSKNSFFKFYIKKETCSSCSICEKSCPVEAINGKEKTIDYSKCITCFNCIDACPKSGISYGREVIEKENGRREFLLNGLKISSGLGVLFFSNEIKLLGNVFSNKTDKILPPGSKSFENFSSKCIACFVCVGKCPSKIIKTGGSNGKKGLMQPFLDYKEDFCNFECNLCSQVCPTNAIAPISLEDKKRTQVGLVELDKTKCLVYKQSTACGACSEHCPTKAVYMIDLKNGLRAPETDKEYCIGCGACEHVCPAKPIAIKVKNLNEHGIAKNPKNKILKTEKPEINFDEEFPF